MRKLELVYLHELLTLVRNEYEQQHGHAIYCEQYDQLRTHPQAIAQPKATHNEAIQTLARDLTTDVAEQSVPATEPASHAPTAHHET